MMIKKVLIGTVFLIVGGVGGFVLGIKGAGVQYEDRKNLVSTVRQLEQAEAYVNAFSQGGDVAVKSLILEDIKLHLMGTRLLVSKVPDRTKAEACQRLQRVAAKRQQIIQFVESGAQRDPEVMTLLDRSTECMSW
jgi:hypothetical protein